MLTKLMTFMLLILIMMAGSLAWPQAGKAALSAMEEEEMSSITAREGIRLDFQLDLVLDNITINDDDGGSCGSCSGNGGVLRIGEDAGDDAVHLDNGSGGQASLSNMTIDSDANNLISVKPPGGGFSFRTDEIRFEDGDWWEAGMGMHIDGIQAGNTKFLIGPN